MVYDYYGILMLKNELENKKIFEIVEVLIIFFCLVFGIFKFCGSKVRV